MTRPSSYLPEAKSGHGSILPLPGLSIRAALSNICSFDILPSLTDLSPITWRTPAGSCC